MGFSSIYIYRFFIRVEGVWGNMVTGHGLAAVKVFLDEIHQESKRALRLDQMDG